MKKAAFLDRDGVINMNVLNANNGEWKSPLYPKDFELFPWTIESLRQLQTSGFDLFLVSNQPSYAKGKTSMETLKAIQRKFHSILLDHRIHFTEYYYCYHHPQGVVQELSVQCDCRKPGTLFLRQAERTHNVDLSLSWMIGDRESDVMCGQRAGLRTILVVNAQQAGTAKTAHSIADFAAGDLSEAAGIVIRNDQSIGRGGTRLEVNR